MAIALDTNIFIYAHHEEFVEHKQVRPFLQRLLKQGDIIFWSWQVYYEYLRIVTHPKIMTSPLTLIKAIEGMQVYLTNPHFQLLVETEEHPAFFAEICKKIPSARGNFVHDCHYAALLKENGILKVATTDADFRKFDFLEVVNPLYLT